MLIFNLGRRFFSMKNLEDILREIKNDKEREKVKELFKNFQKIEQRGGLYITDFLTLSEQYYFQKIGYMFSGRLFTTLEGGVRGAERKRGFISDKSEIITYLELEKYFLGGNILSKEGISAAKIIEILNDKGISYEKVGDIWFTSDGLKIIFAPEIREELETALKEIGLEFYILSLSEIKDYSKSSKILKTTETSKRLDAIGSFALGISRSKMQNYIKGKAVRVNGKVIDDSFFELNKGDIVEVQGLGSFKINSIKDTSKGKFHIEMERNLKKS